MADTRAAVEIDLMPSMPDLGPLPRADGGSELQRESFNELRSVLPASDWVPRDERTEDFGVDLTMEVIAAGAATNLRAQVQLKGRRGLSPNADGSYSVAVEVANLNYLLNGLTPVYILYRPETREFWYAFARDELRRIGQRTPHWKKQQEITLRLTERLDAAGLDRIRARVVDEGLAMRKLHDMTGSLAPGDRISVDATTLEATSPVEAQRFLLDHGMQAVASGFGNLVLTMCGAIAEARFTANPKLSLVRGYADFTRGHYLKADPSLRDAWLNAEQLTPEDRHFLQFLIEAVDLAVGSASADEFRERTREWRRSAPTAMAAQYDLLETWMLRTSATSENDVRKHDTALREAVERVRALDTPSSSLAQQAEMLLLFAQVQEVVFTISDVIVAAHDPRLWALRFQELPPTVLARETKRFLEVQSRFVAIMSELEKAGNIPLLSQALYTQDLCAEMFLSYQAMASQITGKPSPQVPDALIERVRKTAAFAKEHDQVEVWLRAGMAEADLEDLRGNVERAKELTRVVLERARTLRFVDIERIARRSLDAGGMHSVRRREIEAVRADNLDSWFLSLTPKDIDEKVSETREMLHLDAARDRFIREGLECEIDGARARYTWCRHLHVMERDTGNDHQAFSRSPERCCRCERFQRQSLVTGSDWAALITAFKKAYCDVCSVREPKQGPESARS